MKLIRIFATLAFALNFSIAFSQNAFEVKGEGQFRLKGGSVAKSVTLSISNGEIKANGIAFDPAIFCPGNATDARLTPDGFMTVLRDGARIEIGQVFLVKTGTDSKTRIGNPGDTGFGLIAKAKSSESVISKSEIRSTLVPSVGKTAIIKVNAVSEIQTSTVTLDQISEIGGNEEWTAKLRLVSLGVTPPSGMDRIVTVVTIQSALRTAKIPIETIEIVVPPLAKVRRETRILNAEELATLGRNWIEQNMPNAGPVYLFTKPIERRIATGVLTLTVTSPRDTGKTILLTVTGKIGEETQFTQQLVFNKGLTVQAPTVKSGSTVQVRIVSGGISIEVTGQVKSISGENVTIYIPETKATLVGKQATDGTIEVKL